MHNLITADNLYLAFGSNILLDQAKFQITAGERVCLIGRNGAGKSSLLKIIEGTLLPDNGEVWRAPGLKLARLAQDLPQASTVTVYTYIAEGLAETGQLLLAYHALSQKLAHAHNEQDLAQLAQLQQAIDAKNGWAFAQQIDDILERFDLAGDKPLAELSGGWRRRAALARAFVAQPDLLLLDEPTNHLDIATIQWLENELINANTGLLFITHDRALLQRLATRILELDRGHLTSWPGDYPNFLRRKEEMLHAEAKQHAEFDKKLAQEERWIRQGIKARRTRNEGRVRALKVLRHERKQRREQQGRATFNINTAEQSGQLVIKAEHITHHFAERCIIKNFSIQVMRGDRIGLIGPNGIGKSTLLNILLGKLAPQQGTVTLGTRLQVAYFDQLRETLDDKKNAVENVIQGSEMLEINGKKQHIMSYLADFLFTPQRALMPVSVFSGGECNRLVLAKLFSQPNNLLVMDEPTNDLDIETLELLEELLANYQGTLLLVSHDRAFLDNVVTSTLVFEGNGKIQEYIGGYNDWLQQAQFKSIVKTAVKPSAKINSTDDSAKKISQQIQKELAGLPSKIEKLEARQDELQQHIASQGFYQQDKKTIDKTLAQLTDITAEIKLAYARWETLEKELSE